MDKRMKVKLESILNSDQDMSYHFKTPDNPKIDLHLIISELSTHGNALLELIEETTPLERIYINKYMKKGSKEAKKILTEWILKSNTWHTIKLTSESDNNCYRIKFTMEFIESDERPMEESS